MNKKAILKELIKDPQIKALYNEGFDRSIVNKLIIESLIEEEEDTKLPKEEDLKNMNKEQLINTIRVAKIIERKTTDKKIQRVATRIYLTAQKLLNNMNKTTSSEPQQQTGDSGSLEIISQGHYVFGRPFVIVKTSKGNVAFYKSTGKGSPEISKAGDWQPFGGVVSFGNNLIWMVKGVGEDFEWINEKGDKIRSKVPNPKSELGKISSSLKTLNENKEELEKVKQLIYNYFNFAQPNRLYENTIEELAEAIITNQILHKHGALTPFGNERNEIAFHGFDPINPGIVALNVMRGSHKDIRNDQKAVSKRGPFTYENLVKLANEEASSDSEKGELVPTKLTQDVAQIIAKMDLPIRDKTEERINFLAQNYGKPDAEQAKKEISSSLSKAGVPQETAVAILNDKQAVKDLEIALQNTDTQDKLGDLQKSLKSLYDAVKADDDDAAKDTATQIYNMIKGVSSFEKIEQTAQQLEKRTLKDIKVSYTKAYEDYKQDLGLLEQPNQIENDEINVETKKMFLFAIVVGLYNAYNRETPEDEQPTGTVSGTVSADEYSRIYNETVGNAFDNFEDFFLTTPFLSRQSEVLTELVNGIGAFGKQLKDAGQQSFNKGKKPNKPEQEINEEEQKNAIVKFDPRDQKLIMSEHKEMQKYLKMLVNVVTSIDAEKINTVGFEQDSRKARAIAKKLKKSIEDLFKILNKAKQEKRKGLEFNESILREEIKPRTQLTRDQIIGLMEDSYDKIVDYMTEIERETIDKKESIDIKLTTDRIEKLNQVFNKVLPYFPSHAPFGKEGNLGQIKKHVRQISRDIIQIIKQSKNLVERPDDFDEKAISRFDSILKASIVKLSKYFDLEIDDKEIKAMLPKIPPAKSASYGKDSEGIFNKIQDLIKTHSPKAKKLAKKISKKYSPEIRKALKKGMGWAKQYAKTLGEKAKPYLDKVKKAFAKVGTLFNKYVDKYLATDINIKLDDNDINEISKSLDPGFDNSVFEKVPVAKDVEWEDDGPDEWRDRSQQRKPEIERLKVGKWKDYTDGNGLKATILNAFLEELKNTTFLKETDRDFIKDLKKSFRDKQQRLQVIKAVAKTKRKLNLSDTEYTWLKQTVASLIKNDRALFYALLTDDSEDEKNEQIERSIEKIIEHYFNTGKL